MKDQADTICALSTPPGRSGLALVRISGMQSFQLLSTVFKAQKAQKQLKPRIATLGQILDPKDGAVIDEAIATCFPSPYSYTGEDMVELSLHGNPVLIEALLEGLCFGGARIAEPGEFTMRAFLHGRMDLTQAEAVRDIIEATTRRQATIAARQRGGSIAQQINPIKEKLIEIIINLESTVEFAEEDITVEERVITERKLDSLRNELGQWIDTYRQGKIVRDGFILSVIGRPNVGKSSVFNAMLSQERSIVTGTPGTTRDLVSEYTHINGIPIRLLDTAGIRNSDDRIEQLGISRTRQAIDDSDCILMVVDQSQVRSEEDMALREQLQDLKCILVMNKSDLPCCWTKEEKEELGAEWPCLEVSAKTGFGIDRLRTKLISEVMGNAEHEQDGIIVTNLRQYECLGNALKYLDNGANTLKKGISEEFALEDLHRALKKIGEITGETQIEDLLGLIFSRFCIGK
jgi:tRNA modification GTPase